MTAQVLVGRSPRVITLAHTTQPISAVPTAELPKVSVVIPALNEAQNLSHVLPYIPHWVHEVLLVDGHSVDDTVEVARSLRPDIVIVQQQGKGKGAALRSGFAAVTGDIIVMLDADGSTDPREIPAFVGTLLAGADFAKGSRFLQGGGTADMPLYRKCGNWGFVWGVRLLFGGNYSDLCYGYNAFWTHVLPQLNLNGDGFEIETMMNVRALRAGMNVAEVPSFEAERVHGTGRLRTIPDGWRVLKTIVREWRSSRSRPYQAQPTVSYLEQTPVSTPALTISVVISAYTESRWNDLVAAVRSVQQQAVPAAEIIVVVDHHPVLLQRVRKHLPEVKCVENTAKRGLSGARNTGISYATGDIVAFLDDDAQAAPDWLAELSAGYTDSTVHGVGGTIEPSWEQGRPAWFPQEFDWVVGCTYQGMAQVTTPVRNLIGCNMSFRRSSLQALDGFRSELGRIGTRPLGCEETELCIRTHQRWPDSRLLYRPIARVTHRVPVERASWRYFLSRCYNEGLSKAVVAQLVGRNDGLSIERTYTLRTLPRGFARGLLDVIVRQDVAGLRRAGAIATGLMFTAAGYLHGTLALRFAARRRTYSEHTTT